MAGFSQDGLNVTIKDTQDGNKLLSFWGIGVAELDPIVKRLSLIGGKLGEGNPKKGVLKVWKKGGGLFVITPADMNTFVDVGLKGLQAELLKSGKYDNDEVMKLTDVIGFKANVISKQEMDQLYKDAKVSEIDMWQNYLSTLNDEKTRKVLELYAKIYGNTSYGHMLSLTNVMTIRNINPDATFVLGASSWKKYDRGVKRGAKPYPLWGAKPIRGASTTDIKQAQEELGHELENFDDLSVAVKDAIIKTAEQMASKSNFSMYRYLGYDIADTYRIHPNDDDPLLSKPSIVSNITRELNQLAQEAETKKNPAATEEIQDEHAKMLSRTEKAANEMEKICAENNIKCDQRGESVSMHLANMLLDYYSTLVTEKANILKQGNIKNYAEDCVQLTLLMDQIGLDCLNRFKHSLVYTQEEAAALAPVMKRTVARLGRAAEKDSSLDESLELNEEMTKDSFLQKMMAAMKQLGIKIVKSKPAEEKQTEPVEATSDEANKPTDNVMSKEEFKESFDTMLNKLNSVRLW